MDYSIAAILPSRVVAQSTRNMFEKRGYDYPVYSGSTAEAVSMATALLPKGLRLVISHGLTYQYLCRYLPVPVMELPFSGIDAMVVIKQALDAQGKIVHLGTKSLYHYLQRGLRYLGVEQDRISFYELTMEATVEEQAQLMIDAGFDVFIGGYTMVDYVRGAGKKGIEFDVDELIIEATILNARTLVDNMLLQEQQHELDKAILQASSDAILAIDQERHIFNINAAALRIFRKPAHLLLGKRLEEVMKENDIIDVETLAGGGKPLAPFTTVVLNELPVSVRGQQRGSVVSVKEASEIQKLEYQIRKNLLLKGLVAKTTFADITGISPAVMQAKERAETYAKYDSTILIYGETGTGKEMFAQSIHNASNRRNEPFVAINCAALPGSLIESELFGYDKGAFTGANKDGKQGLFELSSGGTIFLDEISELPISIQSKLLRVIQEGEIIRVGGDKIVRVDTRVICSSNKNLLHLIRDGKFKDDLYYRLCVLEIHIPPLRERPEDIECLSTALLHKFSTKHKKVITAFTPEVLHALSNMSFMGNVRELGNIVERMVILAEGSVVDGAVLKKCDLHTPDELPPSSTLNIREAQVSMIAAALEKCGGNKTAAAHLLGIDTSTLWRKMKAYQLT